MEPFEAVMKIGWDPVSELALSTEKHEPFAEHGGIRYVSLVPSSCNALDSSSVHYE